MKKLIVTFSVLFIVLLFMRIIFGYYVESVPVFSVLLAPLVWLTVVAGVLDLVFVGITVYKEFKRK